MGRPKEIGEDYHKRRVELHRAVLDSPITYEQLGKEIGRGRQYISYILNGHATSRPLLDQIEAHLAKTAQQ